MGSKNMTLREYFDTSIRLMKNYYEGCNLILHSDSTLIKGSEGYKNIVQMGKYALPYIKELYSRYSPDKTVEGFKYFELRMAVTDISADFRIPSDLQGNIKGMRVFTREWLNENV